MHAEVYHQLRQHFHHHPMGFPHTESGAELRILERLFSEQEAQIALGLRPQVESTQEIAARTGADPNQIESLLERMSYQGLIFREGDRGSRRYGMMPYMSGTNKFQMKVLGNHEHAEDGESYLPTLLQDIATSHTHNRQINPVEHNIPINVEATPWERASEIVKESNKIALCACRCRAGQKLQGKGCSQPVDDICLVYSPLAEYCLDNDLGREITQEEALKSIQRGEDAGLVRITLNVQQHASIMCQCCPCCCAWMQALEILDYSPESMPRSSFWAGVEAESCTGCEACLAICPTKTISMNQDEKAVVNTSRCLGCGLCVSECPTDALTLSRKPEVVLPPATWDDLLLALAREKGRTYFYPQA
ncbi:MAG: 4Fe-4S binding protein [Dehalococcoidia bacterium]